MSNVLGSLCYLLLILIDNLLCIIFGAGRAALYIIKLVIQLRFIINMSENTKKRKHYSGVQKEGTTAVRGVIDANWQKLLSNKLMMNKGTEKPPLSQNHYTGTFRRARKLKNHSAVDVDLESLQIDNSAVIIDNTNTDTKPQKKGSLTKFIAMDCEMVGIGFEGGEHMLARVSLVNKFGDCVYDKYVRPREEVSDYRTEVSGIRREDLLRGEEFATVQREVAELLRGRVLVGHSLRNDLAVLYLPHPKRSTRDTSKYKPFRKITKGSTPSLKRLAREVLGVEIQRGEHSSVEDARAAMQLYCTVARTWEHALSGRRAADA